MGNEARKQLLSTKWHSPIPVGVFPLLAQGAANTTRKKASTGRVLHKR